MVGARRFRQRLHAVSMRERRRLAKPDQFRDRRHFMLDEYAGRIAAGILLDRERRRRRDSVTRYAGKPERLRVGDRYKRKRAAPKAPDRADENGISRRGDIELLASRPAL